MNISINRLMGEGTHRWEDKQIDGLTMNLYTNEWINEW